jgi:hypothetical protein
VYTSWQRPVSDPSEYTFTHISHSSIQGLSGLLEGGFLSLVKELAMDFFPGQVLDATYSDFQHQTIVSHNGIRAVVLKREHDLASLSSQLNQDPDFEYVGEYRGYEGYKERLFGRVVAFNGTHLVASESLQSDSESAHRDLVTESIDTHKSSDSQPLVDRAPDLKALTDTLGAGTVVRGTLTQSDITNTVAGIFQNQVAAGKGIYADGETTTWMVAVVFDTTDSTSSSDVEQWASENFTTGVSTGTNGRIVTAWGEIETKRISSKSIGTLVSGFPTTPNRIR